MEPFIVLLIGFIASFLGSFTSGGVSLLGFALLGGYGFSPLVALGIFKVGVFGWQVGSLITFVQTDKIVWHRIWFFIVVGVVGTYIGTKLVISIDQEILSRLIGVALLLCLPLALFKPQLGIQEVKTGRMKEFFGHIAYFFVTIYAYSFVVGAGIFGVYSQAYFYGMTLLQIKATDKIPNIIKGVVAVSVLAGAGLIDWKLGGAFFCGALLGGFIGTHYSIKIGDVWLRRILFLTVFVVAIKLLLGL